jgi:hypothetical protein
MTKSATLLAVFLLILGTFVFAAPRVSAQGAAPVWSIGDYWEYSGTGAIMGTEYSMLTRYDVQDKTTISIGSTPRDTFHLTMKDDMTAGSISSSVTYDYWVRTSDLANVKLAMDYLTIQMEVTFDPPQQVFNFPLSDGKIWSSTSAVTISGMGMPPDNFTTTITTNYQGSGPEKITVPAGTFDSFNVTGTSTGASSSVFYSDAVGYLVRTDSSIPSLGSSLNASVMELKSYNYQHNSSLVWVLLIVVIVVVAVMTVVAALLVMSRKKPRTAQQMPPQAPPFPPQTPPLPPQG